MSLASTLQAFQDLARLEVPLAAARDRLLPKRRKLAALRARWGAAGDKAAVFASDYFDLTRAKSPGDALDDKTWVDLELPELFARMDTTVTPFGSQLLFAQLRRYVDDPAELAACDQARAAFATNVRLRECVQLRLTRLADDAYADVAQLLFGERPDPPAHRVLLYAWSLATVALLALVIAAGWPVWVWLVALAINAVVLFYAAGRRERELHAMQHCAQLMATAEKLVALRRRHPGQRQLEALAAETPQRRVVGRTLFWLALIERLSQPDLVIPPMVMGLLKFLFLVGLVVHAGTVERFYAARPKLRRTFELVGGIDASIAVASWLHAHPRHCQPAFTANRALRITDGRHPLLDDGVANSISLDDRSLLVTGSNMAGKTTFIKMLALNAVLGQTLGFCCAAAATLPHARVLASIQGLHSVASGKSHYFAEVEAINRFMRDPGTAGTRIIAIDEPFSGTNTIERIAIARAVLEQLGGRALVLVTTHDVELQAALAGSYVLYHFQENPDTNGYFDYRLRAGPATERNAIRLLERLGFPETVTTHAFAYVAQSANATDAHGASG